MKLKKKKSNPFDLHVEPLKIPRYRINPELLRIIAERRKKKKRL